MICKFCCRTSWDSNTFHILYFTLIWSDPTLTREDTCLLFSTQWAIPRCRRDETARDDGWQKGEDRGGRPMKNGFMSFQKQVPYLGRGFLWSWKPQFITVGLTVKYSASFVCDLTKDWSHVQIVCVKNSIAFSHDWLISPPHTHFFGFIKESNYYQFIIIHSFIHFGCLCTATEHSIFLSLSGPHKASSEIRSPQRATLFQVQVSFQGFVSQIKPKKTQRQ